MESREVTQTELRRIMNRRPGTYPGGFQGVDFFKYINGKNLSPRGKLLGLFKRPKERARDVYDVCSYALTQNAAQAEDKLLNNCGGETCPYNFQRASNLNEQAGIVYVLH